MMEETSLKARSRLPFSGLRKVNNAPIIPLSYKDKTEKAGEEPVPPEPTFDEGYEKGYEVGLAAAKASFGQEREAFVAEANSSMAALEAAIERLRNAEEELRREIQKVFPGVAYILVEEILGREIRSIDDPGREAIIRALSIDATTDDAIVRMNPDDVKTLTDISDLKAHREIEVVIDTDIERGGAIVSVGKATLDARLSTALERVRKTLAQEVDHAALMDGVSPPQETR